jgi:Concanavalin A-like lectin/glucanases superfamily
VTACRASPGSSAEGASGDAGADANHALHFDGVLDYATTGTAGFPPAFAPQTLSLWVRYANLDGTQIFIVLRRDTESGLAVGIEGGTISAWPVYANQSLAAATSPPAPGSWHHVAFVYDPSSDAGPASTLYVDGAVSATGPTTTDNRTPLSSWIGSFDGLSEFYAGDIDELRIWNVARSVDEIQQEMNGEVSPDAPGLVAYFDCDAIYGTRVLDMSGNGNDMTLGGGVPDRMPTLVASDVPP